MFIALQEQEQLSQYNVYGLDDRSPIPQRDRDFSLSHCVQAKSGAQHLLSNDAGNSFPGDKTARA